jgi:hypothetical protein
MVAMAASQSSTLAQGFQTDSAEGEVVSGALVSLKKASTDTVQLANTDNAERVLGVVDSDALVTISQGSTEAQVVLNGTTSALVSDINGTVKSGDKITPSPIGGVGMKASDSGQIVGTATSDASGGKQQTITDTQGVKHTVRITRVSLQVSVGRYEAPSSALLPPFLQSIANNIAGRDVNVVRVLISTTLLVLGFASVLIIVFISVRSAIISIGRNPLAAKDVRQGLYQVLIISFVVAATTGLAAYLLLSF